MKNDSHKTGNNNLTDEEKMTLRRLCEDMPREYWPDEIKEEKKSLFSGCGWIIIILIGFLFVAAFFGSVLNFPITP